MNYKIGDLIETELVIDNHDFIHCKYALKPKNNIDYEKSSFPQFKQKVGVFPIIELCPERQSVLISTPFENLKVEGRQISGWWYNTKTKIVGYSNRELVAVELKLEHIKPFIGKLCSKCNFNCMQGCYTEYVKILKT